MTKQTSFILGALFLIIVVAVAIMIILERDITEFTNFVAVTILPTAVAVWAGNRADKAGQIAKRAADSAEQAVHNTNGRLGELIRDAIANGRPVDAERYADVIQAEGIQMPDSYESAYDRVAERTQRQFTNESLRNTPIE